MNDQIVCKSCRKPKAPYNCGLCHEAICKSCAQFNMETFSFQKKVPEELTHSCYCMNCFDDKVAAPLNEYNDKMEKAKEIILYSKEQTKLTRLLKRKNLPYKVDGCEDEQEAIMRMSFMAVEDKCNCLIDVEIQTRKIIAGSHKKTVFGATAVPINIIPGSIREHLDPP